MIWARAISQVPTQLELFQRRADGLAVQFEISRRIHRLQDPEGMDGRTDCLRLERMIVDAVETGLSNCDTTILENRGEGLSYLSRIIGEAWRGRLSALTDLRVGMSNPTDQRLVRFCR